MDRKMDSPGEQQMRGNWKQFTGKLREAWGSLTDDDLDRFEGRREQLEGHIEEKTGETRENVRRMLDRITSEADYKFDR